MPLTAGLSPSIRQPMPDSANPFADGQDVVVEDADEAPDGMVHDDKGNLLKIEHPDGSITITLDGSPIETAANDNPENWFDNLVDKIDSQEIGRIAEDLLRGVSEDLQSRNDWIEARAQGIRLLGLKLEQPGVTGTGEGAPLEGMSKVRHPMLLEACLRFQANAQAELLPTDGPVKVRNDSADGATQQTDDLANALEKDFNHYLTSTASEYYPDTDRMLLMLGFGGSSFKKVYFCPLRSRPVSESVDANDLIVNNAATDLKNARRVTHRIMMKPSTVKRMQILGVYRDVDLASPNSVAVDAVREEEKSQQGIAPTTMNPDDRDREVYEVYCELDIKGYEHKHKGKPSGLDVPYRVTIDVSSREILSIVRNYDEDTKELPEARVTFVPYTFVPGFGFYGIGLLHILGNTTAAVTAAWRELLDAGMFSNFPGFLQADTGMRQDTNIFRIPPGGAATIRTNGMAIGDAVMPLPYNPPQPAFMTFVDGMVQTGQRVGGTAELQVGEGRQDAPVGTTLALIEQAMKVLNSVHKRMHTAQAEEFQLLSQCFREHPESFWQKNKKPATQWDEARFMQALNDVDIVPRADPNTASHTQRLMKVAALMQLQQGAPALYDPIAVNKSALKALGWSNPEQFMVPIGTQPPTPPEVLQGIEELKIKKQDADAKTMVAQAKAAELTAKAQGLGAGEAGTNPADQQEKHVDNVLKLADLQLKSKQLDQQQQRAMVEDQNRDRDRMADIELERMKMEAASIDAEADRSHEKATQAAEHMHDHIQHAHELAGEVVKARLAPKPPKPEGRKPKS